MFSRAGKKLKKYGNRTNGKINTETSVILLDDVFYIIIFELVSLS